VKRWTPGDQIERWVGSGLLVAERQFRKVIGFLQIPLLLYWTTAFRRLKDFACVKHHSKDLQIWAGLDPCSVPLEEGFKRDVSQIGHAGTGDLEIRIQNAADLARAQPCCCGAIREPDPFLPLWRTGTLS